MRHAHDIPTAPPVPWYLCSLCNQPITLHQQAREGIDFISHTWCWAMYANTIRNVFYHTWHREAWYADPDTYNAENAYCQWALEPDDWLDDSPHDPDSAMGTVQPDDMLQRMIHSVLYDAHAAIWENIIRPALTAYADAKHAWLNAPDDQWNPLGQPEIAAPAWPHAHTPEQLEGGFKQQFKQALRLQIDHLEGPDYRDWDDPTATDLSWWFRNEDDPRYAEKIATWRKREARKTEALHARQSAYRRSVGLAD